jgi:hypothetical protein
MFRAQIWETHLRGEVFYHAKVVCGGRWRVFSVSDEATENGACLAVLEWAQRLGKTELLEWEYKTMRASQYRAVIKAPPMSAVLNMPKYDLEMSGQDDWTKADEERRGYCLKGLERTREAFQEHVTFLFIIREEKLWRKSHDSFQGFCSEELGYDQSYVHKLCGAAEVFRNLLPAPEPAAAISANGQLASVQVLPTTESQVRPLKRLEPAEQPVVWSRAVERAGGKVPTAKIVEEEAERVRPSPKTAEHPALNAEVRFEVATKTLKFGQEVTVAGLQQLFKWDYKEAAEVFDLLVDRHYVDEGKFVAHPNAEGQAECAPAVPVLLNFQHALAWAQVKASKLSGGWGVAWGYEFMEGALPAAKKAVEFLPEVRLENSGLALLRGLRELRESAIDNSRSAYARPRTRKVAKLLAEWCGNECRKLGGAANERAEENHTGAEAQGELLPIRRFGETQIASGKLDPDIAREFQAGFREMVGELARGFIKHIQLAMDVDREAGGPVFETFGQLRYLLGCALIEARRIERDEAKQPETKTANVVDKFCPNGGNHKESTKGFVVCRAPLRGVLDKRHRFDTGGGWGNDPRKALLHETLSEARQVARRHKDKVMALKAAIAIFEKEKK